MVQKKSLLLDAWIWVLVMAVAMFIAFNMLQRDKQRHFGAMSFGPFPAFDLPLVGDGTINEHILKGKVWAIHAGNSIDALMDVAHRLTEIEQKTASGKRHLYILTFAGSSTGMAPQSEAQYIAIKSSPEQFSNIGMTKDTVFLVDQDGVIRGKYMINDLNGYKDFQRDLLGVL